MTRFINLIMARDFSCSKPETRVILNKYVCENKCDHCMDRPAPVPHHNLLRFILQNISVYFVKQLPIPTRCNTSPITPLQCFTCSHNLWCEFHMLLRICSTLLKCSVKERVSVKNALLKICSTVPKCSVQGGCSRT